VSLAGSATLICETPFSFATYGGVGGGFIRSQPDGSGTVTVTAAHPTLGQASAILNVTPASETNFDTGPAATAATAGTAATAAAARAAPATAPSPSIPQPRTPAGPPRAMVKSALAAALSPSAGPVRTARLRHGSGYTFRFDAPSTGKLVIDWYYVSKRARTPGTRKPKRVLVASVSQSVKKAGVTKAKVKLNARGRSLLRQAKRRRLIVEARFTPMGQSTRVSSHVITFTH
jgi:hypothetical protein